MYNFFIAYYDAGYTVITFLGSNIKPQQLLGYQIHQI